MQPLWTDFHTDNEVEGSVLIKDMGKQWLSFCELKPQYHSYECGTHKPPTSPEQNELQDLTSTLSKCKKKKLGY
jgi:hypothetical protein